MLKRFQYILLIGIMLSFTNNLSGQLRMPDNVCIGQTKHYNVDPNPIPGSTYTWWIDGVVQTGINTNAFDHTWNSTGTYLLEVQELSGDGCLGPKRSGQVFVNDLPATPTATVTTQPTCSVATGTITVTAPAGSGITYTVMGTNPVTAEVTNATGLFSGLTPGVYDVTTSNSSCVSPPISLTVSSVPGAPIISGNLSVCAGSTTQLTGSGTPATTNPWTSASPAVATVNGTGLVTGVAAGTSIITYTDINNCSTSVTVKVNSPATISVQPLPQTNCYGNQVQFSVTITGTVGTVTYQWQQKPPSGIFSDITGANSSSLTINNIGMNGQNVDGTEYQVIVTDDCGSVTSAPALLNINTITDITPDNTNTTICSGGSIIYSVTTQGTVVSYQWLKQNGTNWDPISDGINYSGTTTSQLSISNATPAQSGSYRVSVTFSTLNQPPGFSTCAETSSTLERDLTVQEPLSPPDMPANQQICYNAIPTELIATSASGGSGPYTYQWQNSPDGSGWTNIPGATDLTYSPPALTSTTYYRIIVIDGGTPWCGTVNSAAVLITVNPAPAAPTGSPSQSFCASANPTVANIALTATGTVTWYDAPTAGNVMAPTTVLVNGTTYYASQTITGCESSNRMAVAVTVTPVVTPTFTAVGPYCSGAAIPALPTSSNEGITGTWAPAINNSATTLYTFTPTAGQCATTATMTITITPNVTPTFTAVGPYCSGAAIPALPTSSNEGITGTWAPAINNTTTTLYTFTPTAGQCATTTTLTITINPSVTPTFATVGPYCFGATIPALPLTSIEGITGTWAPAINNTSTTTYTFTPTAGQCATTASLTITITPNVTPTFAAVGPYCSGATIPALPTTSIEGITGSWAPVINNTTTTNYTFTPTAGQCATTTTLTIAINPSVTPTFAAVGTYCSGSTIPVLPLTSIEGITGTWSPAIDNTTTTTYTFTPTASQCATTTTLTITINPSVTPTFAAVGPYCVGETPDALPATSNNGITGTWNPAIISTASAGTRTYTFTPDAGQCGSVATMDVVITTSITPTFTQLGPYCVGGTPDALPAISNNGITGTWNPAVISTASAGTRTYTFTPDAGQCGSVATMDVVITTSITPTFTQLGPYCVGGTPDALTATSNNGITGTWNPAVISTASAGTRTYTFTPDAGQCATTATMDIDVISPTLSATGNNPASCGADGSINFTFTNVPDGSYTITYATGSFTNVNVSGGAATVNTPAGAYNNLEISVGTCTSAAGVNVAITALSAPILAATGNNPAICGADGSIDFTFTNVPNGSYTITYATGSFTNVNVSGGAATVTASAGTYNNLEISVGTCTSAAGVNVAITCSFGSHSRCYR